MGLMPGDDVISRVVMGLLQVRPSFDAMRQIKKSGRHGNGEKVISITTRLVSMVKTY